MCEIEIDREREWGQKRCRKEGCRWREVGEMNEKSPALVLTLTGVITSKKKQLMTEREREMKDLTVHS